MASFKIALNWFLISLPVVASCPFATDGSVAPDDSNHRAPGLRHGRRLSNLSERAETKAKWDALVDDRRSVRRSLQEDCLSGETYEAIERDVVATASLIGSPIDRAHFLGGIVRLAAHDFMDYDLGNPTNPMGADGCIDWEHDANAGLPDDIWGPGLALTTLYENFYSQMSRADFWVAAANAVIRFASDGGLDLRNTFKWGRVDADECLDSADRLPKADQCSEVEDVFLKRLGLEWADAVALIGAHTLGRGSESFSGHKGIWVDTEAESLIFDRSFYDELARRPWVPRNIDDAFLPQDWTWGGGNGDSPRFMLNTDMCLLYDSEENFPCCSRTDVIGRDGVTNACDWTARGGLDLSDRPCGVTQVRVEAADAVDRFIDAGPNGSNENFFEAFATAWEKATTNGHFDLKDLAVSCTPTPPPTPAPSTPPTTSPTKGPTLSPSNAPTLSPSTSSSPSVSCRDLDDGSIVDGRGNQRDCDWVMDNASTRCRAWINQCSASCNDCGCRERSWICESGEDCCSGVCTAGMCSCKRNRSVCTSDGECCSGGCVSGECRSLFS